MGAEKEERGRRFNETEAERGRRKGAKRGKERGRAKLLISEFLISEIRVEEIRTENQKYNRKCIIKRK